MCGQKEMLCEGLCARFPLQFAANDGSSAGHESRQFFVILSGFIHWLLLSPFLSMCSLQKMFCFSIA